MGCDEACLLSFMIMSGVLPFACIDCCDLIRVVDGSETFEGDFGCYAVIGVDV